MPLIEEIVSEGQTGADRAALDWAIENGIPHGGSGVARKEIELGNRLLRPDAGTSVKSAL